MINIDREILREKDKLNSMLLENNCEFQNKKIINQSKKVDRLIAMYYCDSMQYVAVTRDLDE